MQRTLCLPLAVHHFPNCGHCLKRNNLLPCSLQAILAGIESCATVLSCDEISRIIKLRTRVLELNDREEAWSVQEAFNKNHQSKFR